MNAAVATAEMAPAFEAIIRSWLGDPDTLVFCGNWRDAGLMELVPRGTALLTGARYEAPFDGLRELRVGEHHVHLDLGRLGLARYVIDESVCYGYRPSFEMRLIPRGAVESDVCAVGLSVASPYRRGLLDECKVARYLERAADHLRRFPSVVSVERRTPTRNGDTHDDHLRIASMMRSIPAFDTAPRP